MKAAGKQAHGMIPFHGDWWSSQLQRTTVLNNPTCIKEGWSLKFIAYIWLWEILDHFGSIQSFFEDFYSFLEASSLNLQITLHFELSKAFLITYWENQQKHGVLAIHMP